MARPRKDPGKLARAADDVAKGMPQGQAAKKHGIGVSTLKRHLSASSGPAAGSGAPQATGGPSAVKNVATHPSRASNGVVSGIRSEVDAALVDLPDDPEARVVGAALRQLADVATEIDVSKAPQFANAVKTLALALREMRGPPPPAPDAVDERLRELDGQCRKRIEAYTSYADAILEQRRAELRAWLLPFVPIQHHGNLHTRLDGLFAPPSPVLAP